MASAQNLLGLCFFGCAPDAAFLGFAWWLQFRSGWGTISLFLGFQKRRFGIFLAAVSQWLRHKTCWGSAFSHARPKHLFSEFGLVACRLPSFTLRCALLEATFRNLFSLFLVSSKSNVSEFSGCGFVWFGHYTSFFLFSGFQKRRFGIFLAAVSQWLRHKTCWGSAFSHARPKHFFLEFGLVACRLPSLTLRCALLEATFRNLFSLFSVGSKSNVLALFWLRFRMVQALYFFLFWAHYTSFFLMGSKSDVSAFFCGWAMASAQNLLGLCFFGCAPDAAFLGFAWWLQFRSGWGTISLFLGVPKATFRHFSGCGFAMASAQNLLGFCFFACASETPFFLSLAWWLAGFQVLRCAVPCLRQPFATFFLCF